MNTTSAAAVFSVAIVIGLTIVMSIGISSCASYNFNQNELQKTAIQAGCSVTGYTIICPK